MKAWILLLSLGCAARGQSPVDVYEQRNRIERLSARYHDAPEVLLAYILAHELAHAIEGHDRHSDSGILKARWSDADWFQMLKHKLTFTDEDVDLIRQGLDARAPRLRS